MEQKDIIKVRVHDGIVGLSIWDPLQLQTNLVSALYG